MMKSLSYVNEYHVMRIIYQRVGVGYHININNITYSVALKKQTHYVGNIYFVFIEDEC